MRLDSGVLIGCTRCTLHGAEMHITTYADGAAAWQALEPSGGVLCGVCTVLKSEVSEDGARGK